MILTLFLNLIPIQTEAQAKTINKIMVIVGDKLITQYEVESFNPKQLKEIYSIEDESRKQTLIKQYNQNVLNYLVDQYTLEIAAEREGITVTDDEVEATINEVLARNNITKEQLIQLLEEEGLTFSKYKWQIKMDILNSRLNSRVIMPMIVVTMEDINKYIDENIDELNLDDKYELRMIVVDKEDENRVEQELKKSSFSDVAIKYSKDKTGKSGGYVGWINYSFMAKEIGEKIKNSEKGDIVKIYDGGSVKFFSIEDYKSKYDIDEELKEEIAEKIRNKRYEKVYIRWFENQKKSIFVKYMN